MNLFQKKESSPSKSYSPLFTLIHHYGSNDMSNIQKVGELGGWILGCFGVFLVFLGVSCDFFLVLCALIISELEIYLKFLYIFVW